MRTVYIYALIDPNTHEIRYVGVTNNLKKRFLGHIYDAKRNHVSKNAQKSEWIVSLIDNDQTPIIQTLYKTNQHGLFVERICRAYCIDCGHRLLNSTNTSRGFQRELSHSLSMADVVKREEIKNLARDVIRVLATSVKKIADGPRISMQRKSRLNRTFVGNMLEIADAVTVAKLAGHTSVNTTMRYDRRAEQTKMDAMEGLEIPPPREG